MTPAEKLILEAKQQIAENGMPNPETLEALVKELQKEFPLWN